MDGFAHWKVAVMPHVMLRVVLCSCLSMGADRTKSILANVLGQVPNTLRSEATVTPSSV